MLLENILVKDTALGYSVADPDHGGPYMRSKLFSRAPFVVVDHTDSVTAPTGTGGVVVRNCVWEH
jgi:hypothetical protein